MSIIYPADYSPQPSLAFGTVRLRSSYGGTALTAYNALTTGFQSINFVGDNLDTTSLDAFLAGSVGRVTLWNDQMGTAFSLQGTTTESPNIQNLVIGGARSLIFQGASQSGALYWMATPDISSLGISANAWTIMAVVEPSSSQYCNQAGAPGLTSGVLAHLFKGDGTSLAAIQNQSQAGTVGFATSGPGAWEATDSAAFDFQSPGYMVPTNPQVLTITSGAHGVRIYVNEQVRATLSRTSLTDIVNLMRIGALNSAVAGANGHSFDGQLTAMMVWNSELSENQTARVRAALYSRFSIDRKVTDWDSNIVTILGDSIAAGYVTLGIYGYAQQLPALLNHPTRIINNAVPGSTISVNPASPYAYTSTVGLFPTTVPAQISQSKFRSVVVIHGGGNDEGIGAALRTGNTHSSTLIDNISNTADLTVGDYVFVSGLSTLSTIQSKTANSVTINHATSTTLTGAALSFTNAASGPTAVYNVIKALAVSALAAGATGVIVVTILPRNTSYQSYVAAINALIVGGVPGAVVVDAASAAGLNTNPGADYADAVHPSALGHQHLAALLAPAINALMP